MSKEKELNSKAFFKEWLEKLQQESWQLELLISGFALFGIYEARHLLVDFEMFSRTHNSDIFPGALLMGLEFLLATGWKIFFINLLVHVILRALWIGAIGLRYVSGEIDYDTLSYSVFYTNYLKRKVGSYDDFIERLERICSVLFSYTFLLFLISLSGIFFMLVLIMPLFIFDVFNLESLEFIGVLWAMGLVILGAIVFIDFITMGAIKKIKDPTVSKLFFPLFYFFSLVTLTFLYRPLIYNFVDHPYTRKLFFLSIPYMLVLFLHGQMFTSNDYAHFPDENNSIKDGIMVADHYYDDLYLEKMSYYTDVEKKHMSLDKAPVRLKQFRVDKDYLTLFIKLSSKDHILLKGKYQVEPYFDQGFNFSLFSDNTNDKFGASRSTSPEYKSIKDSLQLLRKAIRKKGLSELEKQELENAQSALKKKRKEISSKLAKGREDISTASRKRVLEVFNQLVTTKVNNIKVGPSGSYFYTHPKDNAKGVMMYIPLDSLVQTGINELRVERKYFSSSSDDSLSTKIYNLPFIKSEEK